MEKATMFSWGYWGWGSSAAQFVNAADAVEAAREFKPPVFVDIRIQRSVRAVNFSGDSFKKIIGEERYRRMPGIANFTVEQFQDRINRFNQRYAADWNNWLNYEFIRVCCAYGIRKGMVAQPLMIKEIIVTPATRTRIVEGRPKRRYSKKPSV
jgi:hypothetical protein